MLVSDQNFRVVNILLFVWLVEPYARLLIFNRILLKNQDFYDGLILNLLCIQALQFADSIIFTFKFIIFDIFQYINSRVL